MYQKPASNGRVLASLFGRIATLRRWNTRIRRYGRADPRDFRLVNIITIVPAMSIDGISYCSVQELSLRERLERVAGDKLTLNTTPKPTLLAQLRQLH